MEQTADTEPGEHAGDLRQALDDAPTPLAMAIGGKQGVLDSSIPAIVFVIAYNLFDLQRAIPAALVTGGALLLLRLARGEPLRYAINGFLGVAFSVFIAWRMGKAEGYFLPGIVINLAYAAAFAGSLLVRRPLVGVILGALGGSDVTSRRMRLVAWWSTAGWALIFGVRGVVQLALYRAGEVEWLGTARLAMGWPLTGLGLMATVAAVRWARRPEAGATPERSPDVSVS